MAFHTHDGWEFERTADGGVVITGPAGSGIRHELMASEWASVVASVSALGESGGRYYVALGLHLGRTFDPATGSATTP